MGVYIKGMEMPTSCDKCRFFAWSRRVGQHCAVASDITFHATIDGMDVAYERNGNCPLVPVPPHGDLIDRDALKDVQQADADLFKGSSAYGEKFRRDEALNAVANIVNAPTIIPAEEAVIDLTRLPPSSRQRR